jgi:hypothetical protein
VVLILMLLILPLFLVGYQIHRSGYRLGALVPIETWRVSLRMSLTGHGEPAQVHTFLPQSDVRVTLLNESQESDLPSFRESVQDGNRIGAWSGPEVWGTNHIRVDYTAFTVAYAYEIDRDIPVPGPPASRTDPDLAATTTVQVDDPEIVALAEKLAPAGGSLVDGLHAIHKYCHDLTPTSFKGTTDALTAMRAGEASCNGKSRLFVALARHQGLRARLVGGLILEKGSKRTSHQWVEVQVGSYWVPFCPTNDHFASIPASYLPLYLGDQVLFSHSRDVNFGYRFEIQPQMGLRSELVRRAQRDRLSLLSIWDAFAKAGISEALLKVLLMVPLGALVLVIFRNVIGLDCFGTFLPVLIAVASREIGLWWGLLVFCLIILLVYSGRMLVARLNLLHLPQMAILLTFTIVSMLGLAVVAVRAGNRNLSDVSMFPIAILAITTERFALMIEEAGFLSTMRTMLMTGVVITACYLVMNAAAFQILFVAFPQLVLVVIFLDIWLGHWMGLRLLEFWRFRGLLRAPGRRDRV